MQFVVMGYDGHDIDALPRRMAAREAHLQLGNDMREKGSLLYAAAILDIQDTHNDHQKMIGSILITEFTSRGELDEWLKIEPYVTGKVWETIDIKPCAVGPSFLARPKQ